ncbi:MAG: hypothetical protein H0V43_10125 [Gemmatimonadales bacterium]|nr:hypothetical protein [Gemmatimonadales bacterium]
MYDRDSIGRSEEGRTIPLLFGGPENAPVRLLVVAGQHGDERNASRAARAIARVARCGVRLAVVPTLNPDGAARRERRNARGIDLNRDHQWLASAEVRALHAFVRAWRPHLVVDVHTYPSRRKRLLEHDLVHCHDVFLDHPTHPGVAPAARAIASGLVGETVAALDAGGFRSARYVVLTATGRLRHSTSSVADARNGLALRYGMPTLLLEGRQPTRMDAPPERAHIRDAMQMALESIVGWAEQNQNVVTSRLGAAEPGEQVTVRFRRVRETALCRLAFKDAVSNAIREVQLPGPLAGNVRATRDVTLPTAYAIPTTHGALLDLLARHGFSGRPTAPPIARVERYRVRRVRPSRHPGRPPRHMEIDTVEDTAPVTGHMLLPVTDEGGRALAVFLEPQSSHGLHRLDQMGLPLCSDSWYPVLRVM